MRVCIIGDNSAPLDEGMKKVTAEISKALQNHCELVVLNPLRAYTLSFWNTLLPFRPMIIHYVPGPSSLSFVLLKVIKILTRAKTVVSLTHPKPDLPVRCISRYLKPDLMISQSFQIADKFQRAGCHIVHLSNGVDVKKYHPISRDEKQRLRVKYGIPTDAYVVLHIGNTRVERNLSILAQLRNLGCYVLVVSSTTIAGDPEIDEMLARSGCAVWNHFIEHVEEVYALSDCYIFPTTNPRGAIELPLSVLEAMACNLPIITSKFGALPRVFKPGEGLIFVENSDELHAAIDQIRDDPEQVATRAKVVNLSWESIGAQLIDHYASLVA